MGSHHTQASRVKGERRRTPPQEGRGIYSTYLCLFLCLCLCLNLPPWRKRGIEYSVVSTLDASVWWLPQKPCKCHLIDPQVSKGHTTGVLQTLPMVEPRPAFSHTVSPVCKPVWYMLHSTIQCTVIATCIMCTLYTRVGAWVSPPGVENELLKCCLYRGVG